MFCLVGEVGEKDIISHIIIHTIISNDYISYTIIHTLNSYHTSHILLTFQIIYCATLSYLF